MTWQSRQGQSGDEYEKAREEWLAAADRPMAALARELWLANCPWWLTGETVAPMEPLLCQAVERLWHTV